MAPSGSTCAELNPQLEELLAKLLPEELRQPSGFERWFQPLKRSVTAAVNAVHGDVQEALEDKRRRVLKKEGCDRDLWVTTGEDPRWLVKSISSLRSKVARELRQRQENGGLLEGRLSLDQMEKLVRGFGDLGRFRIICDLSSDVEQLLELLVPEPKGEGPRLLLGKYPLAGKMKDYQFDLELRHPARGHRARQFVVLVENPDTAVIRIEIQLMTLLQNAWDRRNHPLYEWTREGNKLEPRLLLSDVALAETLYLVDEQATRNWETFLKLKRSQP